MPPPPLDGGFTGVLGWVDFLGGVDFLGLVDFFGVGGSGAVGFTRADGLVETGGFFGASAGRPGEFRGGGGAFPAMVVLDTGAASRLSGTLPPGGGPPMTGRRRFGASAFLGAFRRPPPSELPISPSNGSLERFVGALGAAFFGSVGRPGELSGVGACLPAMVGLETGAAWRFRGTLPPGGGPPMTGRRRLGASGSPASGFARPVRRVRPVEFPKSPSNGSSDVALGGDGLESWVGVIVPGVLTCFPSRIIGGAPPGGGASRRSRWACRGLASAAPKR
jgi:hypothetical protein